MPLGRSGLSNGKAPAAILSVHFENTSLTLSGPMLLIAVAMYSMAWPACVRIAQAVCESCAASLNSFGISRMPRVPMAWQDWHMFFTVSTNCAWLFIVSGILLPLAPVPGNSLGAGMSIREYQYMPG